MTGKPAALAALLAAAAVQTACVAFPAYPIAEERAHTEVRDRPGGAVALDIGILRYVNGRPRQVPARQQEEWRSYVKQAYVDLMAFDRIDAQAPDRIAEVEIRDHGSVSRPLTLITALTLFLVPGTARSDFEVVTRVRRAGEESWVGESSVRYTYRSYYQLFFLPLMTTNAELTVENEVIYGLARKGLAEALAKAAGPGPLF